METSVMQNWRTMLELKDCYYNVIRHLKGEVDDNTEDTAQSITKLRMMNENHGASLLHNAASVGDSQNIQWLIDFHGLDINAQTNDGSTPLMLATKNSRVEIVMFLLEADADVNIMDRQGNTALQMIPNNYTRATITEAILMKLIEKSATLEEAAAKMLNSKVPIYILSIIKNSDVIKYYLDQGVDVNTTDPISKISALHMAVHFNDIKSIELLLSRGANVNARDYFGCAPVMYIASAITMIFITHKTREPEDINKEVKVLKILLDRGAELNTCNTNEFCSMQMYPVLRHCSKDAVQEVLKANINLQARDGRGCTVLHYLAGNISPGISDILMQYPIWDVNARNDSGSTPLHIAASHHCLDTIQFLLAHGADVDSVNYEGKTPILNIVSQSSELDQSEKCVELLLQYGADIQVVAPNDFTFFKKVTWLHFDVFRLGLAHLALLEVTGTVIRNEIVEQIKANNAFEEYLDICKEKLEELKQIAIHESFTVFQLLVASEKKLLRYLRNRDLVAMLQNIDYEMYEDEYYYRKLRERVTSTLQKLQMGDNVAVILHKIMGINSGFYPTVTDEICSHLSIRDLFQLAEI